MPGSGGFSICGMAAPEIRPAKKRMPIAYRFATPAAAQSEAWEEHKAGERQVRARQAGMQESVLDGVALALPALLRAAKIQRRAARIGFDWPDAGPVMEKVLEEIAELRTEIERA